MQKQPFEHTVSTLYYSDDSVLDVRREPNTDPQGWAVVDTDDGHVELFTLDRAIADAFIAGYDYARRKEEEARKKAKRQEAEPTSWLGGQTKNF